MIKLYKRAAHPFYFVSRAVLTEVTGIKARNLMEFLDRIKNISGPCIYQHTHMFLEHSHRTTTEHTSDFAYWVYHILGEKSLGEDLASIDLLELKSIDALREGLICVIEKNLFERTEALKTAPEGLEFEFMKSHIFILPTPFVANNLAQFVRILDKISMSSIYFHLFDARLRLERGVNDFSYWIETSLLLPEVARKISLLDPYTCPPEGLRKIIIEVIKQG